MLRRCLLVSSFVVFLLSSCTSNQDQGYGTAMIVAASAPKDCTAASPNHWKATSWLGLASCVSAAKQGDTITMAPGTYTARLNEFLVIPSKFLIIDGTGVTITDDTCDGNCYSSVEQSMVRITDSPRGNTVFKNFVVNMGTAVHRAPAALVALSHSSGGKPMRITGITWNMTSGSGDMFAANTNTGVIDHNILKASVGGSGCLNNVSFVRHVVNGGLAGWEVPMLWGNKDTNGDQHLYVEDNTLNYAMEGIDSDSDAQTVFRFNHMNWSAYVTHGADSSGILGNRASEVYNNTFVYDTRPQAGCAEPGEPVNMNGFVGLRGGATVVFNNVIPPIETGQWFGSKPSVRLLVLNLTWAIGGFPCWGRLSGAGLGWPVPHQVGTGWIDGTTNVFTKLYGQPGLKFTQDPEPILYFANTGGGNYNAPSLEGYDENEPQYGCNVKHPDLHPFGSIADYLKPDRDYYAQVANFDGSSGTGYGPHSARPTTCKTGVVYWSTDQGTWNHSGSDGQGVLDKCVATNKWEDAWYVPYTYPHPLDSDTSPGPH